MFAIVTVVGFVVLWINTIAASRTNFQVTRFEVCNKTQGLIKFYGNITQEKDGNHYLTCDIITPIPWGDNLGCAVSIQSKVGKGFLEMFVIHEKSLCKASNTYLGEFWYDIERALQILPKVCPVQAGRYRAHHALVDFNKMTLQTFPFGTLRFILNAVDNNRMDAYIWCLLLEVQNVPI